MNLIISKCSKVPEKENKTRHDWVGKVIYMELFTILKFDHAAREYIHELKSILENEAHKILFDFEIQTDLTHSRLEDQILWLLTKMVDFAVPADQKVKIKENEKRDKFFDLARELKRYGTWRWRWYEF